MVGLATAHDAQRRKPSAERERLVSGETPAAYGSLNDDDELTEARLLQTALRDLGALPLPTTTAYLEAKRGQPIEALPGACDCAWCGARCSFTSRDEDNDPICERCKAL